jgi:hypothetical protein
MIVGKVDVEIRNKNYVLRPRTSNVASRISSNQPNYITIKQSHDARKNMPMMIK